MSDQAAKTNPQPALDVVPAAPHQPPTKSLEEETSFLGYIFMTYLDSLFAIGNRRPLELEDLGAIPKNNRADNLHAKFIVHYEKQRKLPAHKRSLWHAIWLTVGYWRLFLALFLFGVSAALQLGPVMILNRMVKHFEGVQVLSKGQLWILVSLLFLFPLIGSVALAHSNAIMANIGAQVRNTLINVIYRKSLTISPAKRQAISTGRIITMFSDDTNQIRNFLFFLNNAALAPFQIAACLYLIYQQVGVAVFVGLGYSVVVTPVTGFIFSWVFSMRRLKMTKTDIRVKLMNEVLNGIRIIKYYAWENAFVKKIQSVRGEEVNLLMKMGYLFNVPFALLLLGAPQIQTVLIFLTYIGLGNTLDSATAFTTLTLFGIMTSPFIFLPFGLQQYSQSLVSMKRIIEYLDQEDIPKYINRPEALCVTNAATNVDENLSIQFVHANICWAKEPSAEEKAAEAAKKAAEEKKAGKGKKPAADTKKDDKSYQAVSKDEGAPADLEATPAVEDEKVGINRAYKTLSDIHLNIKKGELVGVVGTVGSGKSSLLTAILGEMYLTEGSLAIANGQRIAYCDQRPWIVNATVKDNILFGRDYNEALFYRAIHVAAMDDDLKILSGGVMTEIGERGINLSGGQKARVCIARAVYNDADIYLLDDPLSAVDAHVGEHIFRCCIKEALASKTVILVTHHLHVLPQCDKIVILDDNGGILTSGTYNEIMNSGIDVEKYLAAKKEEQAEGEEEDSEMANPEASEKAEANADAAASSTAEEGANATTSDVVVEVKDTPKTSSRKRLGSGDAATADRENRSRTISSSAVNKKDAETTKKEEQAGKLITKEERNDGDVPSGSYWSYIEFGGVFAFALTMFGQFACQVLSIQANFWLTDWGSETIHREYVTEEGMSKARSFHWFRGYAGMQMASVFFLVFSRMWLTYHRTKVSVNFHDRILRRVLFFPIAFFDVTPIGRIINRFSQDMATIDEDLASTMSQVIGMFGSVIGSLGAIAGSTKGTFLILMLPLGILYRYFNVYFRKSNTAIARIEAISRSPIYADFSQTLSGTTTIRAYIQSDRFIAKLESYANNNTVPGVLQQVASQWLSIRLDFLGACIMFFMGALTVSSDSVNFIPAGFLGLGLSYAISMTSLLKTAVRVSATMEAQFNAVERIRHYALNIEVENDVPPPPAELLLENGTQSNGAGGEKYSQVPQIEKDIEMASPHKSLADYAPIEPPANWPDKGIIEFQNVQLRYREGPLVLKGVSFYVDQCHKIGIAGKSHFSPFVNSFKLFLSPDRSHWLWKVLFDGRALPCRRACHWSHLNRWNRHLSYSFTKASLEIMYHSARPCHVLRLSPLQLGPI
jgi:ATP-binding cassette subfamily C (CFTR/MRP) protein 1